MGDVLFADFETRSPVDIRKAGADVYAKDPNARVMAFGYAFNDDPVQVVKMGEDPPHNVLAHVAEGGLVVAHNAPFEWVVWNYMWRNEFPKIPYLSINQMVCTATMAYAMSLPGSLERAAPAAGIDIKKDMQGNRVMLQLAQPKDIVDGKIEWYEPSDYPQKFDRMYAYCATDVNVERDLYKRLSSLSPKEKKLWYLDHKINQKGVYIDVEAVKKAVELVNLEKERLDKEMRELTNNEVATCNATLQLTSWIKSQGLDIEGVAKNDVTLLLEDETVPEHVKKVLLLRQEAAKASNAKLTSMINSCGEDNRARSLFQYHGAGTGRWAGRRIQVQNLPRSEISKDEIDYILGLFHG